MSNKHCRYLSNQYALESNRLGEILVKPCCHYEGEPVNLANKEELDKQQEFFRNATDWVPGCHSCKRLEASDVRAVSYRIGSFGRIPEEDADGVCSSLDITLDLECNAACMMCSPQNSSTWAKIEKKRNPGINTHAIDMTKIKLQDHVEEFNKKFQITIEPTDTRGADVYLRQIIKNIPLDKLQFLFFKGGEPLMTDFHKKLMAHVISVHPDPKKIVLRYNTNCSIFPDAEVLELWSKFKEVLLILSLDGTKEQFNYIRWPLKWKKVERIAKRFINETDAKFTINYTLTPLNLLYFNDILEWSQPLFPADRIFYPQLAYATKCYGRLDLNYTPIAMRNQAIEIYGQDHDIVKVLNVLPVANTTMMLKYINLQDAIRKQNWKNTFPLAVPFLS